METIIVDAGPFIHLNQINQLNLLKNFPKIYTSTSVISEIEPDTQIPLGQIRSWNNLTIITVKDPLANKIEDVIRRFHLHRGESDILSIAAQHQNTTILTDDLNARNAAKSLEIEVHGTVGIITYAYYSQWIPLKEAEGSLRLLNQHSSLFITSAIIEKAIREIKRQG